MPRIAANGIEIEYVTHGSPSDPALLLVNGFTAQLNSYDPAFAQLLADRGRYVIRYDNRDVGKSSWLDGQPAPLSELMAARKNKTALPKVAYTLSDMAADGMALLSALGIERAHIMGSSMGGMLVQQMAVEHPHRVISMTSIMSTTGEPEYGHSSKEANAALLAPSPTERQAYIDQAVTGRRIWNSQKYFDAVWEAEKAGADFDRAFHPEGNARQMCAILATPQRADALRTLRIPTLVIHGRDDTLIEPSGGFRTAELIPGSTLAYLSDMGHDVPRELWPTFVDLIIGHTARAHATEPVPAA
jgi:pimeloyl-ACP methyl ester carboxylesterase